MYTLCCVFKLSNQFIDSWVRNSFRRLCKHGGRISFCLNTARIIACCGFMTKYEEWSEAALRQRVLTCIIFAVEALHAFHIWKTATMFLSPLACHCQYIISRDNCFLNGFWPLCVQVPFYQHLHFLKMKTSDKNDALAPRPCHAWFLYFSFFCCLAMICLAQAEERLKGNPSLGEGAAGFYTSNFIYSKHTATTSPPGHRKDWIGCSYK